MAITEMIENERRKAVHNSSEYSNFNFMRKIEINTADEHTAEYHIFIWKMVVKLQTKRTMMLNDVFVLF